MKVDLEVMTALSGAQLDGNELRLAGQMERPLYQRVAKVIEAAGGKWNRKAGAHVFEGDAVDTIEPILLTGEYTRTKQDFGQFDTPPALAAAVVELAGVEAHHLVLEPSAGRAAIVNEILARGVGSNLTCIEVDAGRHRTLLANFGFRCHVVNIDFMKFFSGFKFDRICMNPPFAKQADIEHVLRASDMLAPGGRLVSIMSASVTFRTDRKSRMFRDLVGERGGSITPLPPASFKIAGTMINTVMVEFRAPT